MAAAVSKDVAPKVQGAPVQIENLAKYFGEVRAVDGVTLEALAGEFLALLGPSGSGKTTILMTIAGFEQPTAGEVRIGGRPVSHVPPHQREIGMVFQKYALFPHMSVFDNIAFPLRMRRAPAREMATRVESALEMVRLGGYGSRMPNQLSGGQQQRVALARAIVYRPPVLLMDEPLGALDKKLREQMQLEIKHLQQQLGTTVIYVTHDQTEALTMADRIAVLDEGQLMQLGPPEDLYEHPANSFVADFIGETNFLDGVLRGLSGGTATVALDGGPVIKAARPEGVAGSWARDGVPVRVAVRPERITLRRSGDSDGDGFAGTIQEIVYTGASVACMVQLGSAVIVTARVPTGAGQPRWRAGETVRASWRLEDARVYQRPA